jgi:hypothetical protein
MTYKGDILQVLHAVEWRRSGKEVEEWIRRQKTIRQHILAAAGRVWWINATYSTSIENGENVRVLQSDEVE